MKPIPSYGDLIPLEEWKDLTSKRAIIPDDGTGNWATETEMSAISCFAPRPEWATHVVWFNR